MSPNFARRNFTNSRGRMSMRKFSLRVRVNRANIGQGVTGHPVKPVTWVVTQSSFSI